MLEFIELLQYYSNSFLDFLFKAVTYMGSVTFVVVITTVIYWCINKELGFKLAINVFLNVFVNSFIKYSFKVERPYTLSDKIEKKDLLTHDPYSFPSGHSQLCSSYVFLLPKKSLSFGICLILLMGFSRIYLGMHTLIDVITGIFLGIIIALLVNFLVCKTKKHFLFLFCFIGILNFIIFKDIESLKLTVLFIGFLSGAILEEKTVKYTVPINLKDKILNYFIGICITIIIFGIFNLLGIKFLKYIISGFTISYVVPLILKKIERE